MTGRGSRKGGGILSPFGLALVGVIFLSLGLGFLVKGEWAALLFCALSAVLAFRAAVFRSRTAGLQFLSK